MLAQVYLGYFEGVAKSSASHGKPLYGQLVSERHQGVETVQLWPFDFPLSAKASATIKPMHTLWKPQVSVFLETQFAISGMERVEAGRRWRWVAQRWLCTPRTLESILRELQADEMRRPHEIRR